MININDFIETIQKYIDDNHLVDARELLDKCMLNNADICNTAVFKYYEAAVFYYMEDYANSLYWADQAFLTDKDFEPVHEIIRLLTEYEGDMQLYNPQYVSDISSIRKPLNILMFMTEIEIMNHHVRMFKDLFSNLGHKVYVVPAVELKQKVKIINGYLLNKIDFIFYFNNTGLITSDGISISEQTGIPTYNYLFDSPTCFVNECKMQGKGDHVSCVDRKQVEFVKRFFPKLRNKTFFFPLEGQMPVGVIKKSWDERSIEALYVGGLKFSTPPDDGFSRTILDYMLTHTDKNYEESVEECVNGLSKEELNILLGSLDTKQDKTKGITDDILVEIMGKYRLIDSNVYSIFRMQLVLTLVKAGIDVVVYGGGWEDPELMSYPNFHLMGYISQNECVEKMCDTKFVLNGMPWFKDGAHDRVYNAMLCGAVSVTDPSIFLKEQYTDMRDLLYFDLDNISEVVGKMRYLEENPEIAEMISNNGFQKTVLEHTYSAGVLRFMNKFFDDTEM